MPSSRDRTSRPESSKHGAFGKSRNMVRQDGTRTVRLRSIFSRPCLGSFRARKAIESVLAAPSGGEQGRSSRAKPLPIGIKTRILTTIALQQFRGNAATQSQRKFLEPSPEARQLFRTPADFQRQLRTRVQVRSRHSLACLLQRAVRST